MTEETVEGKSAQAAASSGPAAARQARRIQLRTASLAAWNKGDTQGNDLGSLDASLKRNSAYIKRLRTSLHAPDAVPFLLKEVKSLSLEKYTSELVSAAAEGLTKCKSGQEIYAAVDVICAIHERFPFSFSVLLVTDILASLQLPSRATLNAFSNEQREREETARILRQRSLIRVYAELELVGVVRPDSKASTGNATFTVLRDLLVSDKDFLVPSIPLAVAFTKYLGSVFVMSPEAMEVVAGQGASDVTAKNELLIVNPVQQDKFRKMFCSFYEALSRKAVRDHTQLLETDRRNHDAYIRSGEIFEDRAQTYEKMARNWERVWSGVQSLAEALALPLPTLPPLPTSFVITSIGATSTNGSANDDAKGADGIWSDEEEKRFYTDLLDLQGEVPPYLLSSSGKETDHKVLRESEEDLDADAFGGDIAHDGVSDDAALNANAEKDNEDGGLAPAPAAQLTALFGRLPDMSSLAAVDKAAIDFAMLNSKAARRRLVKQLSSVPRSRQDLLPYYSRLVAILGRYMPDVGSGVVAALEDEFRYLQKRRLQDLAETRSKNIRFLSELTKFGITPLHVALHIFKVSLDDFTTPSSIENMCALLEGCGRYLLRGDATRERMTIMLDVFKRKKAVQNVDSRHLTMLENAYYQCDPPDRVAVAPKQRTPTHLFIHHLMYGILAKPTIDEVYRLLRKLHWNRPETVHRLYNAFTKVWKAKFSNIYLFAMLLHDLARHHSDFCVSVIDGILENITAGMERNIFKYNQRRIATLKFLGELYVYRMVDARIILDTLWSITTFGHPDGRPVPESLSTLDAPDDFFRIRLVCTLLDACGVYFDRGFLRKKMDVFLLFFQMYIKCKRNVPMDIDFMITDTFETLRPDMRLCSSFEEAALAVDALFAQQAQQGAGPNGPDNDASDDEQQPYRLRRSSIASYGSTTGAEGLENDEGHTSENVDAIAETSSDDDDTPDDEPSSENDDEFEQELARMMSDNSSVRRSNAKTAISDVNILAIKRQAQAATASDDESVPDPTNMKFTMLLKKGAKQQIRSMDVPVASALAVHTINRQQETRAEQQHLKRFVLDYEEREEAEKRRLNIEHAARRGIRLRYAGQG